MCMWIFILKEEIESQGDAINIKKQSYQVFNADNIPLVNKYNNY